MTTSNASREFETQQFIDDLTEFSRESMQWCAEESEKASRNVSNILGLLMEDAKRISKMSSDTLQTLQNLRDSARKLNIEGRTADVIRSLRTLCEQNKDATEFIFPLVEALQFQDRITQMMANQVRMLATWAMFRSELPANAPLTEDGRLDFGKKLLECTTMKEERDYVRSVIVGLPAEEKVDDVMMF